MVKIICTGNPEHIGIAKEIKKIFPNAAFVSRSSGFDLSTNEGLEKLKNILPNFNILINSSYISAGTQEKILNLAKEIWSNGHVFNIGSLDEYELFSHVNPRSHQENNRLKALSINYNSDTFKVTHITVGIFKSSIKPRTLELDVMDPCNIAETIKWVLAAPIDIPVIGIQKMSDKLTEIYKRESRN
jgi:hypothetical protein